MAGQSEVLQVNHSSQLEEQHPVCGKCQTKGTAINYCRDCASPICEMCTTLHKMWLDFSKHQLVPIGSDNDIDMGLPPPKKVAVCMYCSHHSNEELDYFCKTCGELICDSCKATHQDHHYYSVASSAESDVEQKLSKAKQTLESINARFNELDETKRIVEDQIRQSIKEHQSFLGERQAVLLQQLNHVAKEKLDRLEQQRQNIQAIQSHLTKSLSNYKECRKTSNFEELTKVVTEISKYIDPNEPLCLECEPLARLKFSPSSEFAQACQQFGEVYMEKVSPEKCHALGKGLEVATANEKSTVTLCIVDDKGNTCALSMEKLICKLISDTTTDEAECLVKRMESYKYEISYTPPIRGRYRLHIKIDNKHVKGSPFIVTVKLPVHKLGTPIKTISGVREPWGVAVNQRGEIIVAEDSSHCISIYGPKGEKITWFDSQDSGYGQIDRPRGVAVDDDGNILVVERGRSSIQVFTSEGKFIKACGDGIDSGEPVGLKWPKGIAIHPFSKRIYVADDHNHLVKIINPDHLSLEGCIGDEGSHDGQFKNPWDVAFDSDGNVYVADKTNHRVQVFTADGTYMRKFGKKGSENGELNQPSSICIDCDDIVYVTEYANHRVSVFDCKGTFLTSFGTRGSDPKQFERPRGITVDKSGIVYVCDSDNDCVKLF